MAHSLPIQLTSFVGRRRELDELARLLAGTRLLTLTGVGGAGKTRLALELATRARTHDEDVCFADLAPLADPRLLPQALAAPLQVIERRQRPLTETLAEELRERKLLLVLDNCEHLVAECAELGGRLLRSCPELRILATSREPLGTEGEQTYAVPSLSPEDARELFVQRVRLAQPGFDPDSAELQAIGTICERLDRIPLALELAAVRLRTMSLGDLLERLGRRLQLLTTGPRTAVARQRTLRAAVEWSYDLLSEPERVLFRRLAVFAGGFDLAAAETVCAGEPLAEDDVAPLLASLVERSLALAEGSRYRLLETLRQYARERLLESGEAARYERRHAERYLELAESAHARFPTPGQIAAFDWIAGEHDNLRAALGWFRFADSERHLRLAAAVGGFWAFRGQFSEGRNTLHAALEDAPAPAPARAHALRELALTAWFQGDYATALALTEEAVALARELGDAELLAGILITRGVALDVDDQEAEAARGAYEEALKVATEAASPFVASIARSQLARTLMRAGDLMAALPLLEESARTLREIEGGFYYAEALMVRALLARIVGDDEVADAHARESLALHRRIGSRFGAPITLDILAGVAAADGRARRALRLAGAAEVARETVGLRMPPWWPVLVESWLEPALRELGPATARVQRERGRALTLAEAADYALAPTDADGAAGLTRRELEIAELLAEGLTNREIAGRLIMSVRTAESHVEHIRTKLGVRSRAQIATWVAERRQAATEDR